MDRYRINSMGWERDLPDFRDRTAEIEKDLTWLLDILKGLGAVAGSLTSLALLFVIIGYTIVLSFIQEMKLYGLANFPREFFKEEYPEVGFSYINHPGSTFYIHARAIARIYRY